MKRLYLHISEISPKRAPFANRTILFLGSSGSASTPVENIALTGYFEEIRGFIQEKTCQCSGAAMPPFLGGGCSTVTTKGGALVAFRVLDERGKLFLAVRDNSKANDHTRKPAVTVNQKRRVKPSRSGRPGTIPRNRQSDYSYTYSRGSTSMRYTICSRSTERKISLYCFFNPC